MTCSHCFTLLLVLGFFRNIEGLIGFLERILMIKYFGVIGKGMGEDEDVEYVYVVERVHLLSCLKNVMIDFKKRQSIHKRNQRTMCGRWT